MVTLKNGVCVCSKAQLEGLDVKYYTGDITSIAAGSPE